MWEFGDAQIYKDEQDREEAIFEYIRCHWTQFKAFCARNPKMADPRREFISATHYEWAEWLLIHDYPEWLEDNF